MTDDTLLPGEIVGPLEQALDALEFAQGALYDAIGFEDGLDSEAGWKVIQMIRAALEANGRALMPLPREDEGRETWIPNDHPSSASSSRAIVARQGEVEQLRGILVTLSEHATTETKRADAAEAALLLCQQERDRLAQRNATQGLTISAKREAWFTERSRADVAEAQIAALHLEIAQVVEFIQQRLDVWGRQEKSAPRVQVMAELGVVLSQLSTLSGSTARADRLSAFTVVKGNEE